MTVRVRVMVRVRVRVRSLTRVRTRLATMIDGYDAGTMTGRVKCLTGRLLTDWGGLTNCGGLIV